MPLRTRASEVAEHALERTAELLAHQLLEVSEPHRRDVVAERREPPSQLVPLVLGKAVELNHRDHLTDLHRRAAALPERVDELPDQRRGALFLGRRRAPGVRTWMAVRIPAQRRPCPVTSPPTRPSGEPALGSLPRLSE